MGIWNFAYMHSRAAYTLGREQREPQVNIPTWMNTKPAQGKNKSHTYKLPEFLMYVPILVCRSPWQKCKVCWLRMFPHSL